MRLPETAWRWPRVVAPVPAPHISASRGRFRRAVEQQELGQDFVDKQVERNFAEEAAPAACRDEPGPITLCRTATASRRGPTGGLGAAALDRAASGQSTSPQPGTIPYPAKSWNPEVVAIAESDPLSRSRPSTRWASYCHSSSRRSGRSTRSATMRSITLRTRLTYVAATW